MWIYQKKLEFPVNITTPDLRVARALMAQYGGPDSELAAGCRYLTQRFSMPDDRVRATLNDIGTEEIAHWEMIGVMINQSMRNASLDELTEAGLIVTTPCTVTEFIPLTRTEFRLRLHIYNARVTRLQT